jgi:hypothetical protein
LGRKDEAAGILKKINHVDFKRYLSTMHKILLSAGQTACAASLSKSAEILDDAFLTDKKKENRIPTPPEQ